MLEHEAERWLSILERSWTCSRHPAGLPPLSRVLRQLLPYAAETRLRSNERGCRSLCQVNDRIPSYCEQEDGMRAGRPGQCHDPAAADGGTALYEPLSDELCHAFHHPMTRTFAAHIDVAVICVADMPVSPALQLAVEFVEHEVAEQRRKRSILCHSVYLDTMVTEPNRLIPRCKGRSDATLRVAAFIERSSREL